MTKLIRYGYVPFMLLGLNGAAAYLASRSASELWLVGIIAIGVASSFAAERILPYRADWNTSHDDAHRDTAHAVVNETLILSSVAVIPILAAITPFHQWWPSSLPFVVQLLIAIVIADFGTTTIHLASHRIGWLWRLHAVHHSVKRFYGLNGLMKHPLHQTVEMIGSVLPLVIMGMTVQVGSALAVCVAVQLMLQHANVDYRVGPLRSVLALNEGHRFHHLKWAGIGDVNFGLFTLIWDHLYRTYSFDRDRQFTSDDLGMAAKPNYPAPYLQQLAEPFHASGACHFDQDSTDEAPDQRAAMS
ncbi:sterol desaturase family protein [Mycobacterium sp. DL440]|uniref:sterol desaturase family protein n=1 Tax=Mycobacterium sp. DL440 TaxID=2675523 RepID=UPI00142128C0|nr:sterol desaturase family protein [Mycobacterium sp. DL440]